jgi:hypothetical protein
MGSGWLATNTREECSYHSAIIIKIGVDNMPYIYKISNDINDKLYIGKTLYTIERRWYQHKNNAKNRQDLKHLPLYSAMNKYGIEHFFIEEIEEVSDEKGLEDWAILSNYDRIQNIELGEKKNVVLKEYDDIILSRFNYSLKLTPWLKEGITQEAIDQAKIGFYPGGDQITIPHFDINGRFVGLRGRTLCKEEGELYGKYRPLRVNNTMYNHPLGMNLYNLNNSKNAINIIKKAIVFEGEKSALLYKSYFGVDNDISVACCGSNLSAYQVQLLIDSGAEEIIVAFDRQFQEIGDKEHQHLVANFKKLHAKYKNFVTLSFMFDRNMITSYKASPIDEGPEKFLTLFSSRVFL